MIFVFHWVDYKGRILHDLYSNWIVVDNNGNLHRQPTSEWRNRMDNSVDISIVGIILVIVSLSIGACIVLIATPILASWLFSMLAGAFKALWLLI